LGGGFKEVDDGNTSDLQKKNKYLHGCMFNENTVSPDVKQ
jgi:hypothetical protein